MSPRLIPWSLAASGLLASLVLFAWHGNAEVRGQRVEPHSAGAQPIAAAEAPPAAQASGSAPRILILPPAPDPQSEGDPNVTPVPDDEPIVEDLPARRGSP